MNHVSSVAYEPKEFDQLYSLELANKTLPLIQAIVGDIVASFPYVQERHYRLTQIGRGKSGNGFSDYEDELDSSWSILDQERAELESYIAELDSLGVILRDPVAGYIDFPSQYEDRPIALCWKLGEKEITHWHELEEDYCQRKPVSLLTSESLQSDTSYN